ncbi:MAG: 50S ribosomal protein L30 [Acidimicrobiales bacterium]
MDLVVTQVRSSIGAKPKHRGTLRALGLGRIGKSNTLPDRPEIRGMIAKVPHMITVDEEAEAAPAAKQAPAAEKAPAAKKTTAKKATAKKTTAKKATAKKTPAARKTTAARKATAKKAAAETTTSRESKP